MPTLPTIQPSFAAGELSPFLWGRVDLAKYRVGARKLRNFFVHPHGGASNRPGTRFVGPVEDHAVRHRLIPFQFRASPSGQNYVLVFGHRTLQIVMPSSDPGSGSGFVLNGLGVPYTLATPYEAADLARLKFVQSADTMTLTHPGYVPRKLTRTGHAAWMLTAITFAPATPAPTGLSGSPGGSAASVVVTGLNDATGEESLPSAAAGSSSAGGGVYAWNVTPGCSSFNIYKRKGSIYGFVAQVATAGWTDANLDPDIGVTPPQYRNPFASGSIASVAVVNGGSGYASPTVTAIDQTGSGATFTPTVSGGHITGVTVNSPGARYSPNVVLQVTEGAGSGAALQMNFVSTGFDPISGFEHWAFDGITILSGGSGYHAGAYVLTSRFDGVTPDPNGSAISIGVSGGVVVSASIAAYGDSTYIAGYFPTAAVYDSAGGGAVLTPTLGSDTSGNPQCTTYYQQRQVYAGSSGYPQNLWFSNVGAFNNMATSQPTKDSDAITRALTGRQVNEIRHLVPAGSNLLVMTSGAEWRCWPGPTAAALTPASCATLPQTAYGSSHVPPIETGNALLFVQERGSRVRELRFDALQDQYQAADLSVLSSHLFGDAAAQYTIEEWAFAEEPFRIVWAVRDDGALLGFTYMREHDVYAWHLHATDGSVESVASIAEDGADALYLIVRRTVNGQAKRYVERLVERRFASAADAWFVDCGLSYEGAPVTHVSDLDHLEGKTVAILGDGAVVPSQVVSGGSVALDGAYSKVIVGLPFEAELETLDLELPALGTVQGRLKKIARVTVRVKDSRGLEVGLAQGPAQEVKQRSAETLGTAMDFYTGDWSLLVPGDWNRDGRIRVRQRWPLPCTVLDLIAEVAPGG